jgi:hypothetical protein
VSLKRTEAEDHRKWLEAFPRLCDRCGGTGKIAKLKPSAEDSLMCGVLSVRVRKVSRSLAA